MNKEEYFKESEKLGLPRRCPILNICERHAYTMYFFGVLPKIGQGRTVLEKLKNKGWIKEDFESDMIEAQGEMPEFHRSEIFTLYHNTCPEIPLFDDNFKFPWMPKIATTFGEWDKLSPESERFKNFGCKHFSECPEFANYHYESKVAHRNKRASSGKKRVGISKKLRFEILQRDNFTCQYCKRSRNEDGVKLEIDHKIPVSEGGKTEYNNLTTSCYDCNQGKSNKVI